MCLNQDFILIILLVIVAPTLKVVRNLFQTFYLHVDSSIIMVQMLNDCMCITLKLFIILQQVTYPLKSSWQSPLP